METRRKSAAKTAQHRPLEECDIDTCSDTESVVTQRAFEDEEDSDFAMQEQVRAMTNRKRLASSSSSSAAHQGHPAKKRLLVERQPTRRPDPNVSNRNALMARENRKRKKEQLEQLEHENGNLQSDLKKLQKVVDRQEVMIRGLRNERNYLKSVLENQSDIVRLLKKLQPGNEHQQQRPAATQSTTTAASSENGASPNSVYSDSGMSFGGEESPFHDEENNVFDNGTTDFAEYDLDAILNADFPLISTDLMFSASPFGEEEECALLDFDFDHSPLAVEEESKGEEKNGNVRNEAIRSEHNYVYPDVCIVPPTHDDDGSWAKLSEAATAVETKQKPGICLHIGGGKVSIEFCSQCHASATKDWHFKRL